MASPRSPWSSPLRKTPPWPPGTGSSVTPAGAFCASRSGSSTRPGGTPRPDLAGAFDVDLSATPFTNTLPIRRLGLAAGQAETIHVVYVRFPDLEVTINRQRYTCLEPRRRYRYESVDSDFTREIEVDPDGLVVTYPGLFRRVL